MRKDHKRTAAQEKDEVGWQEEGKESVAIWW